MVIPIPNDIFQYSVPSAPFSGLQDAGPTASALTNHGTYGIGIFCPNSNANANSGHENAGNDTLILLDSTAYRVSGGGGSGGKKGAVSVAAPEAGLPFAMVTPFAPTCRSAINGLNGIEALENEFKEMPNSYVSFRIKARFESVLLERDDGEVVRDVEGTIFGFAVPVWAAPVSGKGVRCCFLGDGVGGEVGAWEVRGEVLIEWAKCGRFHLGFPQGKAWEGVHVA